MKRPLRTLHVNTERGWRGGEQQMLYLVQGLRSRGILADAACRRGELLARRLKGLRVNVLEIRPRGELDAVAAWRLSRFIVRRRPDIVHAHTAHAHTLCLFAILLAAPWTRRAPRLFVSRRVDFSVHKLPLRMAALKYRFGVARYFCVSNCVRDVLARDGVPARKIRIVRSAVDLRRFENVARLDVRSEFGLPVGAPIVLTVGALVEHKAHWHLVRAMQHVIERVPGAACIVVGEGPTRGRLEGLIRDLHLDERVFLAGHRSDPLSLLREAQVFVMCSDMEGLGAAMIEAMAMRVPVVATRAGGLGDVVADEETGLLVPPASPDALAEAIVRVLRDPALGARLADRARRRVEAEFTVERLVRETIAAYQEVLAPLEAGG